MIDFVHKDLFLQNSVQKKLFITSGDITITNTELHNEKFSIKESLCSQSDLVFGSCEASELEFTVSNIFSSLIGKTLTVEMAVNGDLDNKLLIGKYKVYSDKPTANRRDRNVKAYDFMYDILNADVTEWYNTILPTAESKVTVAEFRASFLAHFGLSAKEIVLINDDMCITRTIDPATLSGKDVITKICEINACFGHIGRSGDFEFIYLQPLIKGLYPREDIYPSETLYPREPNVFSVGTRNIISANAEDYLCANITRVQVRQNSGDIGGVCGTEGNDYIIQDNFLLYGKSPEELDTVAQRILDVVKLITYRPFTADIKGNPCVDVGDLISIGTKYMLIDSYVLERTLKGIQSLRDSINAEGQPSRKEKVNGINSEIKQLRGKANELSRTIEETRMTISDLEKGVYSEIQATATQIRTEITNTANGLDSKITQTDSKITAEVKRATDAEASLSVRADEITTSVTNLRNDVTASLKVNSDAIAAEVKRAGDAEAALQVTANNISQSVTDLQTSTEASITTLSNRITAKVSSSEVQSMIDISLEDITISSSQIHLEGYFTANRGFVVDENGSVTIHSDGGEYWIEVDAYGLNTYRSGSDVYSGIRDDGFFLYTDYEVHECIWYTTGTVYLGFTGKTNYDCQIRCDNAYVGNNLDCDTINGGIPITSDNAWEYLPQISITTHTQGGMVDADGVGAYYYSTDSAWASGDNKTIPTIQWVKNYVMSKIGYG